MQTADVFRARIDAMINLKEPLAVLASRLPWAQIEASVAAKFERQERAGQVLEGHDMFGPTQMLVGAGTSSAGRPRLPIRLIVSVLYRGRQGAPTQGRRLCARQAVPALEEGRQAPAHDPGHRHARGAAQEQGG